MAKPYRSLTWRRPVRINAILPFVAYNSGGEVQIPIRVKNPELRSRRGSNIFRPHSDIPGIGLASSRMESGGLDDNDDSEIECEMAAAPTNTDNPAWMERISICEMNIGKQRHGKDRSQNYTGYALIPLSSHHSMRSYSPDRTTMKCTNKLSLEVHGPRIPLMATEPISLEWWTERHSQPELRSSNGLSRISFLTGSQAGIKEPGS